MTFSETSSPVLQHEREHQEAAPPVAHARVRVAVLNDFDLVVRGVSAMLEPFAEVEVVTDQSGEDGGPADVDVILFDTYGRQGIPWGELQRLAAAHRSVALLTFTFTEDLLRQAREAGVRGYLWKGITPAALATAVRRLAGGEEVVSRPGGHGRVPPDGYRWPFEGVGLTARESEVLALLTEGLNNRAIARSLSIGQETVKSHVREIFRKLGVHTRTEATARALRDEEFARHQRSLQPSAR